jgi:imidazolonepropionase-like amidohydrolase
MAAREHSALLILSQHILLPGGMEHAGALWVENGRIRALLNPEEAAAFRPEGAATQRIDAGPCYLSPGLIDAHTHLGVYEEGVGWAGEDGNEMTDPITPHVRALDAINPEDVAFREACEAGITSVMVTPGSGNVIGGQVCVVRTHGRTRQDMLLANPIGIKMAMGENPKRVYGKKDKAPMTRMGIVALVRETLHKARQYMIKRQNAPADKPEPEDFRLEALVPLLTRQIPARIHAHRHDDILAALALCQEFNLRMVSEHCTEGWKIADTLAEAGVPANAGPTWTGRSKVELKDLRRDNVYQLYRAGVRVSIITDHPVIPIEDLPTELQKLGKRFDIPPASLLDMVTKNPAETLGIAHRIGALRPGLEADLSLWTHHPADPRAVNLMTVSQGRIVYNRGLDVHQLL